MSLLKIFGSSISASDEEKEKDGNGASSQNRYVNRTVYLSF
jgi:hypothetical protein